MKYLKNSNSTACLKTVTVILFFCITSLISFGSSRIKAQNSINSNKQIQTAIFSENYALNGEWIYYISLYDSNMYRMKRNGDIKELLSGDRVSEYGFILIDEWIYYINTEDENRLYKIKTDGGEKAKVSSVPLKKFYGNIFGLGNCIYFYGYDNVVHKYSTITKEIYEVGLSEADFIKNLTPDSKLEEKKFYYKNSDGIFEMNINSRIIRKIDDANVYGEIMIEGNWIYYINSEDLRLYRVDIDTHTTEKISDGPVVTVGADYDSGGVFVENHQVYYTNISGDGVSELNRFNAEDKTKSIIQRGVEHFVKNEDYLYYIDKSDNGTLYRINRDGTDLRIITSGDFIPYIDVREDVVFFMLKSENSEQPVWGRLFKIRIDGEGKTEIM